MRVIKRKKGGKAYYYLQHSYRVLGSIITKERYLGKGIPNNVEDIKKIFLQECNAGLFMALERIKAEFQKEWYRYPKSAKKKVLEQIAVAFTYNTNAIEGSKITLGETRDIIEYKMAPHKDIRDIRETENHAKVFLDLLGEKKAINNKILLKWHFELFKDTKLDIAGRFRDYNVRVADYRAPDWQEVKRLMKNFIIFFKNNRNTNPIELSARLHYKFEKIHPFGDGNGRIGRLLTNYILWRNNYPMIIIEYKKRKSYYKALEKDEEKFLNYFIKTYVKVHRKYLE